ncbi:hypothetical protein VIBHAR_05753 [Vibrio campbellii ATCC BAA-1116]|uniref:Uncharacterized protein n=1 Tax=Vibrio campbellii (strain ATCC BAA-1116) TaxID=2902295 RepID=A7N534_VIBC1|nr:hypothetical protein VIBHAR_05753 [Vibrio campbellii ATCC BAA-1116]
MRNAQLHIIDEKCHVSGGYLSLIFRCLFDDRSGPQFSDMTLSD